MSETEPLFRVRLRVPRATSGTCHEIHGDFNDLLFGFWGTAGLVLLPLFLVLAALLTRVLRNGAGKLLAAQLVLFGIVYPCLAGLDGERQSLYLNLCALLLLAFTAWQVVKRVSTDSPVSERPLVFKQFA